ncbi:MAG: L-aspartate oxidase [Phycisphaerae bacterium]|nr:L-aspartate oxidase [Phycisphaerae bacterium]
MNRIFDDRRYLVSIHSRKLPHHFTDCLVIGSGAAGLRAAIQAADSCQVLLVTKSDAESSNTFQAQGGVAVVLDPSDTVESHIADTLTVGAGLCDEAVVRTVVTEGVQRVEELIGWGAQFDSVDGRIVFGREGGHSFSRVVHAHGDATGREISQTLLRAAKANPSIEWLTHTFVLDVITDESGRCRGAIAWRQDHGMFLIWAASTILATGGAGQVYRESTNPPVATADGHAIAWRAGATLADMEMVQFHPTTLYIAGASRSLISEAVRGEGAYLLDRAGHRFMPDLHPLAELAPRDVVSRAIWERMAQTNSAYVLLDVRHIGRERFARRFPGIYEQLNSFDIDIATTPIPVRPAAHYMMGGARVDLDGRTNVPGLFAVGEVSATGLHGATRLASNSLLEALVFGARAGRAALENLDVHRPAEPIPPLDVAVERSSRTTLDLDDIRSSLRSMMGRNLGVEREGDRLAESCEIIDFWARYVMDKTFAETPGWEFQNMLTVSALIAHAAISRTESRGAHYRRDYPETDDAHWRCHLDWTKGHGSRRRDA